MKVDEEYSKTSKRNYDKTKINKKSCKTVFNAMPNNSIATICGQLAIEGAYICVLWEQNWNGHKIKKYDTIFKKHNKYSGEKSNWSKKKVKLRLELCLELDNDTETILK